MMFKTPGLLAASQPGEDGLPAPALVPGGGRIFSIHWYCSGYFSIARGLAIPTRSAPSVPVGSGV